MTVLSFVTTCKGRLAHLRQTLPLLAAQGPECETIVVDYDCPEHSGAWVKANFPQVAVVDSGPQAEFRITHARNLGAAVARSPWIMFIDADVLIAPGFYRYIRPLLDGARLLRPATPQTDLWGSFIVPREAFMALGGFDEVLRGYGGDDDDMCYRIAAYGRCAFNTFPDGLLSPLTHDDEDRMRFRGADERWLSQRINAFYLHIKYDLMQLAGAQPLAPELRQSIHAEVGRVMREAHAKGESRARVTVNLPMEIKVPIREGRLHRQWIYELEIVPLPAV